MWCVPGPTTSWNIPHGEGPFEAHSPEAEIRKPLKNSYMQPEWERGRQIVTLKPLKKGIYNDVISISESIVEKSPRPLRGGAFYDRPAIVRSAFHSRYVPSTRFFSNGFRSSRTYH